MKIERVWAMPDKWTFKIKPIAQLLKEEMTEGMWIDPFAGQYSPAQFTNDINPKMPTGQHRDALEFINSLSKEFDGALFDPPYSLRQIKECYEDIGIPLTQHETTNFYSDVKAALTTKIRKGGKVISFGWNTNGLGLTRGFEIERILIVAHGRSHNDTLITVERKVV